MAGLPINLPTAPGQPNYLVEDNFNDGNDQGWIRFNPFGNAAFEFANGRYRLSAPPSPVPNLSAALVGAFQPVNWGDLEISVNVTGWLEGTNANQYIILPARQKTNANGTSDFYGLRIVHGPNPNLGRVSPSGFMAIEKWVNSAQAGGIAAGHFAAPLDPTRNYRVVFSGRGSLLRAWVYEVGASETLLGYAEGTDEALTSGAVGLLVIDRFAFNNAGNRAVGAAFDNFKA